MEYERGLSEKTEQNITEITWNEWNSKKAFAEIIKCIQLKNSF